MTKTALFAGSDQYFTVTYSAGDDIATAPDEVRNAAVLKMREYAAIPVDCDLVTFDIADIAVMEPKVH